MSEDHLLQDLGDLAREQERAEKARLDERWDRLAAGTLSTEEEAELLALAETSPEAREAYEAFRPLGPEFQARMVEALAAELPKEPKSRLLVPRPTSQVGRWMAAAAALAAACLAVLLRSSASMPALPVYNTELSGGVKTMRGEEPAPANAQPVFVPGSLVTLVARPQKPIDGGRLEAHAFLSPQTGKADLMPWTPEPSFEIDGKGAVRLRGTLGEDLQLPPGAWTVWVVVARKGRAPSVDKLQSELLAGQPQPDGWQAVCPDLHARASRMSSKRAWQTACANLRVEAQPPS